MIPIENEKRIDWNAIRAEYIGGGISQRKLAKKYCIAEGTLLQRANTENWSGLRNQATIKSITRTEQKTAEAAADNATISESIKKTMLLRLKRIAENYPHDATEIRRKEDGAYCIYRIKDIADAFKSRTEDMPKSEDGVNALLQSLIDLERGHS